MDTRRRLRKAQEVVWEIVKLNHALLWLILALTALAAAVAFAVWHIRRLFE